jgi:hypothetical protein
VNEASAVRSISSAISASIVPRVVMASSLACRAPLSCLAAVAVQLV